MSVRVTTYENKVALFDSVTGFAFGPTFDRSDDADSFIGFVWDETDKDPRACTDDELRKLHGKWCEVYA